jgi:hypothetical protein
LHNFLADLKLPEGIRWVIVLDGLDDVEGKVKPFVPSKYLMDFSSLFQAMGW